MTFTIRRMTENEVQIAVDWAKKEGWNPGIHDAHCFYKADPQGFFVGLLDGQPIATGCAVAYGKQFAFCGLYIVKPEFRGQGYGMQLTEERLKYVGNRITGLDGVLDKVDKYRRLGYVASHKNTRYAFDYHPSSSTSKNVVDLKTVPLPHLEHFDRQYFPAPRLHFLRAWTSQQDSYAFGYVEDETLRGYGVIRKCFQGHKIGPLFAESATIAHQLFETLCTKAPLGPIYIDIPEPNQQAQLLVKQYGMTPELEVIRMYRNGIPQMDLQGIYGITTFEIG